ncbi:MAG: LAGLIDADG family homing endonuclease [Candidatus Micrarchaeota archaeon]|nr:LAGLIDADG family homing endonuclease [Candidatus Micrarchaeota archaeon]
MDLGQKLREALAKLTNRPYVDEESVKALIKDLQRIFIASDVSVKLVLQLSKNIEKRALENKKLEALSLREHVLKVVYDELVKLMGETYQPRMDKHKVLLCGLFGSGKCVHPDTRIPLGDGSSPKISELYDSLSNEQEDIEGGHIKKIDRTVFAFDPDTLKIKKTKSSVIWKLKKTENLYKISVDNGGDDSITVTPEHPFFVLEKGTILQKRADEINPGNSIALPRIIPIDEKEFVMSVIDKLPATARIINNVLANNIKKFLIKKFGSLQTAIIRLEVKRPYCQITAELKRGEVDATIITKCMYENFEYMPEGNLMIVGYGARQIRFPLIFNEEFAELLGYIYGDGNIDKNVIHITNEDEEIVNRITCLSQQLFDITPTQILDKRSKIRLHRISIASKLIVHLICSIFDIPRGKKSNIMTLTPEIMSSPKPVTAKLLRAYFDCDGYVESGTRHIEFCTASKIFAYQLRVLLLKHQISSGYSVKYTNEVPYYRVFLRGNETELFEKEIGSIVPKKKDRLSKLSAIGEGQTEGKLENLEVGNLLKNVREYYGGTIGEMQNYVSSYGIYEQRGKISRTSLRKFLEHIKKINKSTNKVMLDCLKPVSRNELRQKWGNGWFNATSSRLEQMGYLASNEGTIQITENGKQLLEYNACFNPNNIASLELLAESDINWGKVAKIELDETTDYVYDLTVDNYHNFVANGIIVHNTTSVAKLAHFYKTRGLSVGVIAADIDRPAAQEQLEQLAKKVNAAFYTIKGEKNAHKIVAQALKQTKEDVIIVDSAGRSAFDSELANELKAICNELKPDETYLVLNADIGQVAGKQAEEFNKINPLSGVIVTKMDGSGKGGGALSAVGATGTKIAFIGTGEKIDDFEIYNAEKFVGRLLGVPDIAALVEKVQKIAETEDLKKLETEEFTIQTFYDQLKAAKKLGPLSSVLGMLGAVDMPKEMVQQSEGKLKKFESIINSMTKAEKKDASLLRKSSSRIERIAKGSGTSDKEVREFLSQFEKMEKMMGMFKHNRGFRSKMEKMLKGGKLNLPGM